MQFTIYAKQIKWQSHKPKENSKINTVLSYLIKNSAQFKHSHSKWAFLRCFGLGSASAFLVNKLRTCLWENMKLFPVSWKSWKQCFIHGFFAELDDTSVVLIFNLLNFPLRRYLRIRLYQLIGGTGTLNVIETVSLWIITETRTDNARHSTFDVIWIMFVEYRGTRQWGCQEAWWKTSDCECDEEEKRVGVLRWFGPLSNNKSKFQSMKWVRIHVSRSPLAKSTHAQP